MWRASSGAPSINVIEGRAAGPAGGPVPVARLITNSGIELELPAWRGLRSGRALSAACRPEHLQLHPGGPLRGPVSVVERLGHETYVYVDTPDGRLCALADRNIDLRPGRPVSLAPVQDAMLLFDTETGRRLEAEINR
jgi:multiple sugar transport system ATP-binding protein